MTRCRLAGPGVPVDGFESHYAHQAPDTFPVDPISLILQPRGYPTCPVERRSQALTVDQFHKIEIVLRDSYRLVVQAGAADVQQLTLTYHREQRMPAVNYSTPPLYAQRPNLLSKKSRSTLS